MVDSKSVIELINEFQVILHEILAEGMVLPITFQTATLIEKLPPCWKDFRSYLKLKKKKMTLEELINKLQVREGSLKMAAKTDYERESKANLMEPLKKRKRSADDKGKKPRFTGDCYNCGKPNHMARDCKAPKKEDKRKGKQSTANVAQHELTNKLILL
ncbi:hypothetical protein ACS0TY_000898 [Phlomoides rotata]